MRSRISWRVKKPRPLSWWYGDAGGFELVDVELELRAVVDQDRDVAEARRSPAKQCEIGRPSTIPRMIRGDRIGLILARLVELA